MKNIKFIPILFVFLLVQCANSKQQTINRETILSDIMKKWLETYHFSGKKIDDDVSVKAFDEYIKKIDYQKRFYTQADIIFLSTYKKQLDDQIRLRKLLIIEKASNIYLKRVRQVKSMTEDILKKPFDFTKKEYLELDSKKRKFSKHKDELKKLWRKILKLDVLNRYLTYVEEQETDKKDKKTEQKKKTKKNKEILTPKQMEAKARKKTLESYKKIFVRILKEDVFDQQKKFFDAIASIFDPHTVYYPPREKEDFDIDIKGSLEGIGALLEEDGDYIKVKEIIPGSASWRQKELQAEDTIIKVAQGNKPDEVVDLVGMRVDNAVRYIRGKKGTTVILTVKKPDGKIAIIPIVRDKVEIEETYVKGILIDKKDPKGKSIIKIGYILVPKFYRDFSKGFGNNSARNCTEDVRLELEKFNKLKVNGIILDLRNNVGGSLEDAKLMAGLFIKKGPIVQVKHSTGSMEMYVDTDSKVHYNGPLVVLQNVFSASASEIVAGALKDYKRAIIVGSKKSHGKGTVQTILNLDMAAQRFLDTKTSLGALKITISKFYRVNGESTQSKGIISDIILPNQLDYLKTGEHTLDYALPWDTVKPTKYKSWDKFSFNVNELNKRSKKRTNKNVKFEKIAKSVKLLKKRRENTKASLNVKEVKKENKHYEELAKTLKYDKMINENLVMPKINFIQKFFAGKKPKTEQDKGRLEKIKEKRKDFVKRLKVDPYIDESISILLDMIEISKFKK